MSGDFTSLGWDFLGSKDFRRAGKGGGRILNVLVGGSLREGLSTDRGQADELFRPPRDGEVHVVFVVSEGCECENADTGAYEIAPVNENSAAEVCVLCDSPAIFVFGWECVLLCLPLTMSRYFPLFLNCGERIGDQCFIVSERRLVNFGGGSVINGVSTCCQLTLLLLYQELLVLPDGCLLYLDVREDGGIGELLPLTVENTPVVGVL